MCDRYNYDGILDKIKHLPNGGCPNPVSGSSILTVRITYLCDPSNPLVLTHTAIPTFYDGKNAAADIITYGGSKTSGTSSINYSVSTFLGFGASDPYFEFEDFIYTDTTTGIIVGGVLGDCPL